MNAHTLLLFSLTVLPLICTPGPDMLFIASQAVSAGLPAGLKAMAGIVSGYCVHSVLVALGLGAVVAASPILFEIIKWVGIAYLVFLACKLARSAFGSAQIADLGNNAQNQLYKGFLTALLNPKGMMIYVAILPQFMAHHGNVALQALMLSAAFMFWCAVVYSILCVVLASVSGSRGLFNKRRRLVDGAAGCMILLAAGFMVSAQR